MAPPPPRIRGGGGVSGGDTNIVGAGFSLTAYGGRGGDRTGWSGFKRSSDTIIDDNKVEINSLIEGLVWQSSGIGGAGSYRGGSTFYGGGGGGGSHGNNAGRRSQFHGAGGAGNQTTNVKAGNGVFPGGGGGGSAWNGGGGDGADGVVRIWQW